MGSHHQPALAQLSFMLLALIFSWCLPLIVVAPVGAGPPCWLLSRNLCKNCTSRSSHIILATRGDGTCGSSLPSLAASWPPFSSVAPVDPLHQVVTCLHLPSHPELIVPGYRLGYVARSVVCSALAAQTSDLATDACWAWDPSRRSPLHLFLAGRCPKPFPVPDTSYIILPSCPHLTCRPKNGHMS